MGARRPWLEALKEHCDRRDQGRGTRDTIFEKPSSDHHAKGAKVPAPVTDINAARAIQRDPDERCLLAAGWTPKDRCGPLGLTIWAHPETGFYYSREAALHRLDNPLPRRGS